MRVSAHPSFWSRFFRGRGFSLIELLIVLAIIALITAVVLARYKSFNSTLLLRNLAYEIALSIREAQTFGISVRGAGGAFTRAYGMHFTPGTTYTLFRDEDDNGRFDTSADEIVSAYTIGQGNAVSDLCAGAVCGLAALDIIFKRPEPDALFSACTSPTACAAAPSADSVRVVVVSSGGNTRTVRVSPTGQIAVE